MNLPRPIRKLIESFEKLPGIGPKTAQRLTFYLLHVPQDQLDEFAQSLTSLKKATVLCSRCFNVAETDPCPVCQDDRRNKTVICVVEQPLDVLALEKTNHYQGLYHVLHGAISPLNNIGPDELYISQFVSRVKKSWQNGAAVKEVILGTNANMEGEATAMYIKNQLNSLMVTGDGLPAGKAGLRVTRLGQGLPTGGDLEYADEVTLSRALEGRRKY